ncbi:MAG: SurA N-terminal domain-containing protein [Bacteroidales bacterium]|nr:SurA N-terminal domain-containing protein [Bacteroidales bacterium]
MGIIGNIRKHSWIAVAIVGIAIVAFIIGDLTKNNNAIPDMGKVDGSVMSRQRFDDLVSQMENNYKMQYQTAQVPSEMQNQIREQVWQNFVDETLLEGQTSKLGLKVTPAEVSDMYTGQFLHPYMRQNFTNPQTGQYDYAYVNRIIENFDQLDTAQRLQWVELERTVKKDRQQQKYSGMISSGFYMPKALAATLASYSAEASNVRLVSLPFQTVADDEVTLADADYKAYYDEHRSEFRVMEEMRDLDFIVFPVTPTPQDLAAIESEVRKVWDEFQTVEDAEVPFFVNGESHRSYDSAYLKPSDFRAPMSEQIAAAEAGSFVEPAIIGNEWMMAKVLKTAVRPDSLRASAIYIFNSNAGSSITTRSNEQAKRLADSVLNLLNGRQMTFEEAVEQFSDDPQKGETKGDLQWQPDGGFGFLNEQIVNTPVGGHFVVEHPQGVGYFVVKVTDKTAASKKYRVALITREIEASKATNDAAFAAAHKFAAANRTLASFEASAQQENLQVRNARVNLMTETLAGVQGARQVVQWAFDEKTQTGTVADQVYECNGAFVVAALKDVFKKGYASLDQVRPMIEQQVRNQKKADVLMARANDALKIGKDINTVATKLGVAVDTLDSVSFNDYYLGRYGMEPKVQSAIAATKSGVAGPVKGSSGVYVIQVDGKVPHDAPTPDAVKMQLEQSYRNKARFLTQALRMSADITDQRNKFF